MARMLHPRPALHRPVLPGAGNRAGAPSPVGEALRDISAPAVSIVAPLPDGRRAVAASDGGTEP